MKIVDITVEKENGNKTNKYFKIENDLEADDLMKIILKELKTNEKKAQIIELIKGL